MRSSLRSLLLGPAAGLCLAAVLTATGARAQQSSCNTTGVAEGCSTAKPYSCAAAGLCYAALDRCAADPRCAPGADTCNATGVGLGCGAAAPYTCGAAASCYVHLSDCIALSTCSGALSGPTTCNVKGVASGCTAAEPYGCQADGGTCHATLAACTASAACPGTVGFTVPGVTCNTSGVAYGCPSNLPYSCQASNVCHPDAAGCAADSACPGKGGGCTAAIGWAPALALLLLVPWRKRVARRTRLD